MKNKKRMVLCSLASAAIFKAFDTRLNIVTYKLRSPKLKCSLRIALITDLHNCQYGVGQQQLIEAINAKAPDLILLAGDIIDDKLKNDNAKLLTKSIGKNYPCYFASGNHEYKTGDIKMVKEMISAYKINVLEGTSKALALGEDKIVISGVDDLGVGEEKFSSQLVACKKEKNAPEFNVLVVHRPELIETYLEYNFDLIVAGHAHGGQWRIPGVLNGLYAPGQGLFPKYAGGSYFFEKTVFIVSRGLARETTKIPRIFNRPELVIIKIN